MVIIRNISPLLGVRGSGCPPKPVKDVFYLIMEFDNFYINSRMLEIALQVLDGEQFKEYISKLESFCMLYFGYGENLDEIKISSSDQMVDVLLKITIRNYANEIKI